MIIWNEKTGCGVTEASTMGWRPGDWPASFESQAPSGRKRVFLKQYPVVADGELVKYVYASVDGWARVDILND